jgi:acetyltransferase-like isoleucine patch superfamily enzyme
MSEIGDGCVIGDYSIIHPGVSLGDGTIVGNFCELGSPDGAPLVIGAKSLIRSYTSIQGGSTFGNQLQTGQYTMIRSGTEVGFNFQVGSNCELQGQISIGDYVRIQSGVHLGKGTVVRDLVWIFPNVLTVNDPLPPSNIHLAHEIDSLSCIAANTLLMPGVRIGFGSFVAASSVVRRDVPIGSCVSGDPATVFTTVDKLVSLEHRIAHPWPKHFSRTLDTEGIERAKELSDRLLEQINLTRRNQGTGVS